jgi:hypothetical protein
MATGLPAFPQTQMALLIDAILHEHPVGPSLLNPEVVPAFDVVIERAMEKSPAHRYQSSRELEAALTALPVSRRASRAAIAHWLSGFLG